jgi:hypothetical protein
MVALLCLALLIVVQRERREQRKNTAGTDAWAKEALKPYAGLDHGRSTK